MIEVAFRNILVNDPTVSGIVASRVYFTIRPQDQRAPSIVLSLVSSTPGFNLQGRAGYVSGRMQLTCLAPDYATAKSLASAARDAIDGYTGSIDNTTIGFIETENMRDLPSVPLVGASAPASYGVNIDANFLYLE